MTPVRTRIAPSPTGFLHLGTARTALYSWAYARHHGGQFVLRIEDTDVERSSAASVQQILDSMHWLALDYDEGPIYQMDRLARYQEVIDGMLQAGTAYRCWCTPAELDAMREAQKARGEKTRYDGRWRPEPGKTLPEPPPGVQPVVRFRNPLAGEVQWDDLVKGPIRISNTEIDDLIIQRPAPAAALGAGNASNADDPAAPAQALAVPTYNFAVVVDDWDMRISHVFRGDEHINNTPWQINLYHALGAPLPRFGHCPVILGDDGQKLSKRRGAVSVTAYEESGYLPEAMLNYLSRLGWSHGDEELFSREQMVQWFDGSHLSKSPAQWDAAKLAWVNAQYLKRASDQRLAGLVQTQCHRLGLVLPVGLDLAGHCTVYKERCSTTVELAQWAAMYAQAPQAPAEELAAALTEPARAGLALLHAALATAPWDKAGIAAAFKASLAASGLKMPQLAMPVRLLVCGCAQTPSVDAVLALFEREVVLARLAAGL